jgi:L-ribulose-5-phosphate 4-epimerase
MISPRYRHIAEEAYEANLGIPKLGLAILTWGNASAADVGLGVFAIKPSGVAYGQLDVDSMVIVDFEGAVVEGSLNPSSDTPTHAALYRAWTNVGGIVHTHSPYATSWAQACSPVPVFGTTHADQSAEPIPCTPYLSEAAVRGDYEAETGKIIVETLAKLGLAPKDAPMILVAGHGPFTWGASAEKALHNAATLEELCKMALCTRLLSPGQAPLPAYIVDKHWERKHGAGAYYGQKGR